MFTVYVGWDKDEESAYMVNVRSLFMKTQTPVIVVPLIQAHLRAIGMYQRKHEQINGVEWDHISKAPMSTQFALTRFFIPYLNGAQGWAIFTDSDMMWRDDIGHLQDVIDDKYAVMCVKHNHTPSETQKMRGKVQTQYPRKNWSSFVLWNCAHPAHKYLTLQDLNGRRGLDLHKFYWLDDKLIGELDPKWNWLEGWSSDKINPSVVHFTRGTPEKLGYNDVAYAEEWRKVLYGIR